MCLRRLRPCGDRVHTAHRRHCRVTHDIGIAEKLAQDALVTTLELWPEEGIPENPGAWLMTAAKRRAIDSPKASSTTSRLLAHRLSVILAP